GYAALFSKNAISLRDFGFDRIAHTKSFQEIVEMWQPEKVVELSAEMERGRRHTQKLKGVRFAIWGAGSAGSVAVDEIREGEGEVALVVDKDGCRHGADFYGVTVKPPQSLLEAPEAYDFLVAANYTRFPEIRDEAVSMGIPLEKIRFINNLCEDISA
ncbi:MAG: hypothetical protein IJU50_08185, partial [Lachnospiraceae bacterium]|nr:hypothetical protein [Lachnospiraceae bacterium]